MGLAVDRSLADHGHHRNPVPTLGRHGLRKGLRKVTVRARVSGQARGKMARGTGRAKATPMLPSKDPCKEKGMDMARDPSSIKALGLAPNMERVQATLNVLRITDLAQATRKSMDRAKVTGKAKDTDKGQATVKVQMRGKLQLTDKVQATVKVQMRGKAQVTSNIQGIGKIKAGTKAQSMAQAKDMDKARAMDKAPARDMVKIMDKARHSGKPLPLEKVQDMDKVSVTSKIQAIGRARATDNIQAWWSCALAEYALVFHFGATFLFVLQCSYNLLGCDAWPKHACNAWMYSFYSSGPVFISRANV